MEEGKYNVRWMSDDCFVDVVEANVNPFVCDPDHRADVVNPIPVLRRRENYHSVGDADSVSYRENVWSRGSTSVRRNNVRNGPASVLGAWRFVDTESFANERGNFVYEGDNPFVPGVSFFLTLLVARDFLTHKYSGGKNSTLKIMLNRATWPRENVVGQLNPMYFLLQATLNRQ